MAKKSVTQKELRQMYAARQGRKGGRFLPLSPEMKVGYAKPSVQSTQNTPSDMIGLLEAIRAQRAAMGFGTGELEQLVIGETSGVRARINAYIRENRDQFDVTNPAGAAAYELLQEAASLSEESMKASTADAKQIYQKLIFIRKIAQRTRGNQSAIAGELDRIIAPIEVQLKKRTSFAEYVKEKVQDFKKTLPEKIVSQIPVVGGFLGQFVQQRRIALEELEKYSGQLGEKISERTGRGGLRGGDLGRGERMAGVSSTGGSIGNDSALRGINSTLGQIYKEVFRIRSMIENKMIPESDAAELRARESELEGTKDSAIKNVVSKATGKDATGKGGFLSNLAANLLGSAFGPALASALGAAGGSLVRFIGPALAAAAGAISTALLSVGTTLLSALTTLVVPALVASVGAAIGTGLAWLVNTVIDKLAGTNLSELMFQSDTWTFGDAFRDREREAAGKQIENEQNKMRSSEEYIKAMSADPRTLPQLVSEKKLSAPQALDILNRYESQYGAGEDTKTIRQRLIKEERLQKFRENPKAFISASGAALSAATVANIPSSITAIQTSQPIENEQNKMRSSEEYIKAMSANPKTLPQLVSEKKLSAPQALDILSRYESQYGAGEDTKTIRQRLIKEERLQKFRENPKAFISASGAALSAATVANIPSSITAIQTSQPTQMNGSVITPAAPNTSLGRMLGEYSAQQDALNLAKQNPASSGNANGTTVNSAAVHNNISNITNNYNDDLRIRDNEPTLKQMQFRTVKPL
jgi:YHS domain-containing protein